LNSQNPRLTMIEIFLFSSLSPCQIDIHTFI